MKTCKMGLQKGEKGTIITFVKKYLPKNRLELEQGVRRLGGEGTLENLSGKRTERVEICAGAQVSVVWFCFIGCSLELSQMWQLFFCAFYLIEKRRKTTWTHY